MPPLSYEQQREIERKEIEKAVNERVGITPHFGQKTVTFSPPDGYGAVLSHLFYGRIIQAIKALRQTNDELGLKEAKAVIDEIRNNAELKELRDEVHELRNALRNIQNHASNILNE